MFEENTNQNTKNICETKYSNINAQKRKLA